MISTFQNLKEHLKKQSFPYITASVALFSRLKLNNQNIPKAPTLPPQSTGTPTLIFDPTNFLVKSRFSPFNMFIMNKRKYSETFIFNTCHLFETIAISKNQNLEEIMKKLDPLSLTNYNLILTTKKDFNLQSLNRNLSKTIFIQTEENEFNDDFSKNTIKIPKYNGTDDNRLLLLADFLVNLYFSPGKWENILESYKNCDFFTEYSKRRQSEFKKQNLFSFNLEEKCRKYFDEIDNERIKQYLRTKDQYENKKVSKNFIIRGVDYLKQKIYF